MTAYLGAVALAAFMAGLMGGAHCLGMCGGISSALCRSSAPGRRAWLHMLPYHVGRITSYAVAGALVGALGQAGLALKGGVDAQQTALLAAALSLIILGLYLSGFVPLVRRIEAAGAVLWRFIQPLSRPLLPATTAPRRFGLGLVWGWLPCGMVYAVLLTALALADPAQSAVIMLAFGAGTLPSMLAISVLAGRIRTMLERKPVRLAASSAMLVFAFYVSASVFRPDLLPHSNILCRVLF